MQSGNRKRRLAESALVMACVTFALVGQRLLASAGEGTHSGWLWILAAGVSLAGLIVRRERPEWWRRLGAWADGRRSFLFVAAAFGLAVFASATVAARDRAANHIYWDVFLLWAAAAVFYLQAFRWPAPAVWRERWASHRREVWLVAGLMLAAAALRFLWLDRIPDVMNGDEGLHSLFARGVLEGANRNPFSTYYGSGSLHLFLAALGLKLFGYTALGARLTPAIGGVLGVGATYLLARRLFGPRAAFVSAALVASLHTHIHFSRVIGVGYIHATLFASLGVYGLYSALETRNALRAALGGLAMGLWLYIYVDARFVPAVLLAWLLVLLALPRHRAFVRDNVRSLAAFAGGYVVAAAPQLTWGFRHLDQFNARFSSDGTLWNGYFARLAAHGSLGDVARPAFEQVAHAFLTITRYPVFDFYQSPAPLLDLFSGALFWLALVYALLLGLDRRHLLLNIWLWSGVLAVGLLTIPRSSDGYRLLIVFIPIVLMLGAVLNQLAQEVAEVLGGQPRLVWGTLGVCLAVILIANVHIYFVQFAPACRYSDRPSRTAYHLGTVLAGLDPGDQVLMLGNDHLRYGTHASAQFLNPGALVEVVLAPFEPEALALTAPRLFVVIPERAGELAAVRAAYPGGSTRQIDDCGAPSLYLYTAP